MKFLVYNIAYGTGAPQGRYDQIFGLYRYLRTGPERLEPIIDYIASANVDVAGLVEVDKGSFRTGRIDQSRKIADALALSEYGAVKYAPGSLPRRIPILRRQTNAFLTRERNIPCAYHYFPVGMKRLFLEIENNGIHFILLHLALRHKVRQHQLEFLKQRITEISAPVVIGGDFNVFKGTSELQKFMDETGLFSANTENRPTFPAWAPAQQLDYILYSGAIRPINFEIGAVKYSDHLPLLFEFELKQ
ncbi:MAG: endonuclease/exonuclease/phosphatase family protein [Lentisphaeria bacterium]|nr:endonuclease/exonuclease/phosphatase family protein [Lentisphaeria bacterium]